MIEKLIERQFRIELFEKDKNLRLSFSKLKYSYDYALSCIISDSLKQNLTVQQWIFGKSLPKQISEIGDSHILINENKIKEEINWILLSIRNYKDEINRFIEYQKQYEKYLILGRYDEAEELLDLIDSEISLSLWSIENRFLLIELKKGLKENTSYLSDINNQNSQGFIQCLSHFFSTKAEKELSVNRYEVNLLKFLLPLFEKEENADIEYYFFKLNPFFKNSYNHLAMILAYENYNSLIDRYLTLVRVFKLLILDSDVEQKDLNEFIINRLYYLDRKVDDIQIPILRSIFDINYDELHFNTTDSECLAILDYFTSGNFEKCQVEIEKTIGQNPLIIELYPIYVKTLILQGKELEFGNKESFQHLILIALFDLYSKKRNPVDSGIILKKIAYNLSSISKISYFIMDVVKHEIENDDSFSKLSIINTSFLNPKLTKIHKNPLLFSQSLYKLKPYSSTVNLFSLIENGSIEGYSGFDIVGKILNKHKALFYQKRGEFYKACQTWEELLKSELVDFEIEIVLINLFFCKSRLGEFDFCLHLYVEYYFINMYLTQRLDVIFVKDEIKSKKFKNIKHTIELPIFFYLTNAEGYDIHTAYECFLLSNDCEKPSEIISKTMEYNDSMIFFLKNICNLEIFKHSPFITSTKNKLNERIKICQFLKDVDSNNKNEYVEEENLLSKRLIIQKGLQEIDESKIYVNQESIILNELKDQKSVFKRYVSIAELSAEKGISFINFGSEEVYNMSLQKEKTEDIAFSKDPQYDIFKEMFFEIRDKFLYSKYGLKLNISTRIRHGVLEGEIRSEFALLNLVTEKEKASEIYKLNRHWEEYIKLCNQESNIKEFEKLMADFSKQIDNYIYDEILAKYLLIKTEKENSEGWLDYVFDEVELQVLYSIIYKKMDNYSDFVTYIFQDLWRRTVKNLEIIKSNIKIDFRNKFFIAIQSLESNLQSSSINVPEELYNNLAEIKTRIDNKLTKIASWFTITDSQISDFDLNKIVEVCCESLQSSYTSKHLDLEKNISFHKQIKGKYFTHLVYLLRIFIQNILDYTNDENVIASIGISSLENQLIIKIENDLRENEDIDLLRKKIQIENDIYRSQLDKRSGLYKALNNIKTNLDDESNEMIIDIVNGKFCVVLKLNLNKLLV